MAELSAGASFGGFTIESLIDRGGTSVVYLAHQSALGRHVALKVMDDELSADPTFRERFVDEARRASAIDHPNILPIYTFGDEAGLLFIAMRYVDGGRDLAKVVRERGRALTPDETLGLLSQAARALDRVHAAGFVHRDVKPENLLVAEAHDLATAHLYLTDFGLVRLVAASTVASASSFAGTLGYAAPEQIRDESVDLRADVYALGCVLYQCLTGSLPFGDLDESALVFAHLTSPPPSPGEHDPELAVADDVVTTAMAKSPDDRYGSCGELIAAATAALEPLMTDAAVTRVRRYGVDLDAPTVVRGAAVDLGAATVAHGRTAEPAIEPPTPPRSRRRWWLAAAVLVVLALVGGTLAVRARTSSDGTGPAAPVSGGSLTVAAPLIQSGWNPTHDLWSVSDRVVASAVFDPLMIATPSGYDPYLAKSVTSNDSTTWTIELPAGVTFHDGTPLDATAVVKDLKAAQADPLVSQLLTQVDDIHPDGQLNVVIVLASPWPSFRSVLAGQVGYIVAPSMLGTSDDATPVGTGPFEYDAGSTASNLVLTKNAHYWQAGKPVLDQLVVHLDEKSDQQVHELSDRHTANVALLPASALAVAPGGYSARTLGTEVLTVAFNAATGPDAALREAMGQATNRAKLVDDSGGDPVASTTGPVGGTTPPWPPDDPQYVAFAPEQAKAHGFDRTLTFLVPRSLEDDAARVVDMWHDNGFPHAQTSPASASEVRAKTTIGATAAGSIVKIEAPMDPSGMQPLFAPFVDGQPSLNLARWSADPVTAAFDQARGDADATARAAKYAEALQTANRSLPYLWLYRDPVVLLAYTGVSNFPSQDTARPVFTDLATG